MKAVLDTNVMVSGLINPMGPPGRIVDGVRAGSLKVVVDDRILAEYADVIRRPMMRAYFTASDAFAILDFLVHQAEHVVAIEPARNLPDPDDAPFLEVALAAGVPLVTGNKKHFPVNRRKGCRVFSAREFICLAAGAAGQASA